MIIRFGLMQIMPPVRPRRYGSFIEASNAI